MAGMAHHLTTRKQISTPVAVSPLARDEIVFISRLLLLRFQRFLNIGIIEKDIFIEF